MSVPTERVTAARPLPWAALTLVFLLSLPAVTVRLYASDEIQYFAYLRSMWFDGDLSFDNEYRYFYDRNIARAHNFKEAFLDYTTPTGVRRNFAPIGSAILWAPFYAVADAGVRVARWFGSTVSADGFSKPYIAAIVYGSAVYGFLAVVLSALAARRIAGVGVTTLAAVSLGTPLVFYMYVAPGFSHACSAFAVAAFVVAWLQVRRSWTWGGVAALGALAGLMGMVREQDVFIALGPAVDYLVINVRDVRQGRKPAGEAIAKAAVGVAVTLACFLPQALAYLAIYGHVGPSPEVQQKMTWTSPNAWRVLVSPDNGWFFWTPLALPAIAGLVALGATKVAPYATSVATHRAAPGETSVGRDFSRETDRAAPGETPVGRDFSRETDRATPDETPVGRDFSRETDRATPGETSVGRDFSRATHRATSGETFVGRDFSRASNGDRRWIGLMCLLMVATQIYVAGSLNTWAGAGSFGQRRLVGLTIFLIIGLAYLFQVIRDRLRRRVLLAVVALCVWWNLGLIAQFGLGLMDRMRVEPRRNAYDNFVTIPRELPMLMYRYAFDRESFYESRTLQRR